MLQVLYQKHGKYPREALFYTHTLPLPLFLLLTPNLMEHWTYAVESPKIEILGSLAIPSTILFLLFNVGSQYICISSVYVLTTECPSLIVTLVVTLRKFASLIFSVVYFGNPFTVTHWVGTSLVFIGTVIFTELDVKLKEALLPKKKVKIP